MYQRSFVPAPVARLSEPDVAGSLPGAGHISLYWGSPAVPAEVSHSMCERVRVHRRIGCFPAGTHLRVRQRRAILCRTKTRPSALGDEGCEPDSHADASLEASDFNLPKVMGRVVISVPYLPACLWTPQGLGKRARLWCPCSLTFASSPLWTRPTKLMVRTSKQSARQPSHLSHVNHGDGVGAGAALFTRILLRLFLRALLVFCLFCLAVCVPTG